LPAWCCRCRGRGERPEARSSAGCRAAGSRTGRRRRPPPSWPTRRWAAAGASRARIDQAIDRLKHNSRPLTPGLPSGAVLLGDVITGLIVTPLLTFFFLNDGASMWRSILGLVGARRRTDVDETGRRVFTGLGGYVHAIAPVGLVDALLIDRALLVIGVPLVVLLMIPTSLGAFLPLIAAFLAGLAAVLIALVFNGVVGAALLVLAAIVLVQQIEGTCSIRCSWGARSTCTPPSSSCPWPPAASCRDHRRLSGRAGRRLALGRARLRPRRRRGPNRRWSMSRRRPRAAAQ